MAQAQFPEPKSLNILEIGDGMDHSKEGYSLEKPHPGYTKDPNIINEYGHTVYPKMIYPNGKDQPGIVVNNQAEEARYYKPEVDAAKIVAQAGVGSQEPSIEELKAKLAALEQEKEKATHNSHPWGE